METDQVLLSWDGLSLDVTVEWALLAPVAVLVVLLVLLAARLLRPREGRRPWPLRYVDAVNAVLADARISSAPAWLVLVLSALWLTLVLTILYGTFWVILTLVLRGPETRVDPDNLRWYLLTLTALTAALGAVVALPITLLRTAFNARQTRTAEQGHITDQINKAVEALGTTRTMKYSERRIRFDQDGQNHTIYSARLTDWQADVPEGAHNVEADEIRVGETEVPNREVRIGGIYALERIAQDSLRDHVQIMEILTAYIRENAPARGLAPLVPALDPLPDDATPEDRAAHVEAVKKRAERIEQAARALQADTVIQAAIQVIARREERQKDAEKADTRYGAEGYRLDLRGTNLRAVDISGGDLSRARLDGAHLEGARLGGAHLEGADLGGAHLEGANLGEAHLEGARLGGAHLEGANLGGAHLEGARLGGAHLERAFLEGAHLEVAVLIGAHLEGADLDGAHLKRARLGGAHLEGANLGGARMEGAHFTAAFVQYAAVKSCDLSRTSLDQDQVNATFGDGSVTDARLPPGVTRPAHWPAADLDSGDFDDDWRKWQADPEGYTPP